MKRRLVEECPYSVVRVIWVDAAGEDHDRPPLPIEVIAKEGKLMTIYTVGFLLFQDDERVIVSDRLDDAFENGEWRGHAHLTIPVVGIVSLEELIVPRRSARKRAKSWKK